MGVDLHSRSSAGADRRRGGNLPCGPRDKSETGKAEADHTLEASGRLKAEIACDSAEQWGRHGASDGSDGQHEPDRHGDIGNMKTLPCWPGMVTNGTKVAMPAAPMIAAAISTP